MEKCRDRRNQTNIYRSKIFDPSYPEMQFFIEFKTLCQKLWAFMPILP